MLAARWITKERKKDAAEKPFWISYADLMTALMMLFLIIMCVSLMSMINAQEGPEKERDDIIRKITENIKQDMLRQKLDGDVDPKQQLISFGKQAGFLIDDAKVSDSTASYLRSIVPIILKRVTENEQTKKWFKRVTVEGYTSQEGTYFHNLDLSLKRASNTLCAILNTENASAPKLSDEQMRQIRRIFMVGGFSANSTTGDPGRDRRVEFRLEFWTVQEKKQEEKNGAAIVPDQFDRMEVGDCEQQ